MRNQREGSNRDDDEGRGLLDKQVVQEDISGRALYLALLGVALVAFIGQLDGSIVAIALPSIAADLDATPSQYVWVGTSYMLSQTIMTPINGRLSDIVGRKPLVYAAVICMGVFSAVSGASKNIHMLLISRALTGLGGGSFTSLTPIIISDMVPYERRMAVQSYMGLIAALAGSMGPLFGGWLAENFSWRWCFYINVPTCILALIMLKLFLRLKPPAADTRHLRKSFDFMGLLLLTVGCASLTVGFANAADTSFINITAYIPIALGAASMIGAVLHILTTGKTAIIPKGLLTHRTPLFFLVSTLCQSLMFIPATFLLPQFFQGVKGYAAEEAGRQMIPYSISIACSAFVVGQIAGRLKDVRSIIWTGYLTQVFAYSLFALFLTQFVSKLHQQLLTALMAAGIGLAISPTMLVIQASVPAEDMAAATSGWVMVRSIGPSIGLALFNALLDTQVRSRFQQIKGYGKLFRAPHGKADYEKLHRLVEPLKGLVLGAFSASFRTCWTVGACLMAFALLLTLTTATRPLGDALSQEKEDEEEVIAPAVGAGSTYGAVGVATRA